MKVKLLDRPTTIRPSDLPGRHIALTFDQGPHIKTPETTYRVLDILEKWEVRGHFFQVGEHVIATPENIALTQDLVRRRHPVGSNSQTLVSPTLRDFESNVRDFDSAMANLLKVLEPFKIEKIDFFRFPWLAARADIVKYVLYERRHFRFVSNMRSGDEPRSATKRSVVGTAKHSIDLLHSQDEGGIMNFSSFKPLAAEALPEILEHLARKNWTVVLYVGPNDPHRAFFEKSYPLL